MTPLPFTWPHALLFWAVFLWAYWLGARLARVVPARIRAGPPIRAGVGVALGSWASAALFTVASIAVYVYRMNVEERALLAVIGEPYRQFLSTRRRLIPFIY